MLNVKGHFPGLERPAAARRMGFLSRRPALSELPQIKAGMLITRRAKRPIQGGEDGAAQIGFAS